MIKLILTILLTYTIFIISFYTYIFNPKLNKNNLILEKVCLIKNKDYILFKLNLLKFYYTTIIILLFFLFKNNGIVLLLNFNLYFILLLLIILIIYSFLLSNFINLKLFYLYKNFNLFTISLNESLEYDLPEVNSKIKIYNNSNLKKNIIIIYYYL